MFHALDRTIVESICVLGIRSDYDAGQKMKLPKRMVGFILYGRLKMFNKNYKCMLERGDTVG